MKFIVFVLLIIVSNALAETINTVSPDKNINISFRLDDKGTAQYMVTYGGMAILEWSSLGLNLKEGGMLSSGFKVLSINRKKIDKTYPIIAGKSKYGRDYCNETKITLEEKSGLGRKLELFFRAYNEGAAFRYGIPEQAGINNFVLLSEETYFNFAGDYTCWAMKKDGFRHSYEGDYKKSSLSGLKNASGYLTTLPVTLEVNPELYVCLSEANITDYAGMYLVKGSGGTDFKSVLSPHPDNNTISVTGKSPAETPWRIFIIGRQPGDLIESNLVLNLNKPNVITDVSWIKPGKSLWSWWTDDREFDADFNYNIMSTNTIMYHIDFAAANNIDYYTIDGGWYGWLHEAKPDTRFDLTKTLPELNLPLVASYANSKGVGIILWVTWDHLRNQMEAALNYFQQLGIKGIKVDFMDRDDQYMVDFYHRIAGECAKRKLLINFHGGYKPDGLERTYPNLITREGVLGNEYAKWDSVYPNPVYNVTIPFTRMVVGPMDYTPGSMVNVTKEQYVPRQKHPMTMGTRSQQLAMLVVYQSGITMLCESPKIYEQLPEFNFIKQVPAIWDSTLVLEGKIGEYIVIARKKGNDWFVGAMTDWNSRNINIDFSFLESGGYESSVYSDADDADTNPQNVKITSSIVNSSHNSSYRLAKGGGLAIILRKK